MLCHFRVRGGGGGDDLAPADVAPVAQGEEVVIAAGQVGGEDESETAGGTGAGESADFGAAAGAEVAAAGGPRVAGAERAGWFDDAGGEAHH